LPLLARHLLPVADGIISVQKSLVFRISDRIRISCWLLSGQCISYSHLCTVHARKNFPTLTEASQYFLSLLLLLMFCFFLYNYSVVGTGHSVNKSSDVISIRFTCSQAVYRKYSSSLTPHAAKKIRINAVSEQHDRRSDGDLSVYHLLMDHTFMV